MTGKCTWTAGWLLGVLAVGVGFAPATETQYLSPKIKAAFRQAAAEPAKSTVQVYCDGYKAVLGVVVDEQGFIVTKASELKGKIEAQLPGAKKLEATLVGSDPGLDLAILKVAATGLPAIAWSESDAPPVGSWLISPGVQSDPVGVGVLSVSPRKISAPSAALGVRLSDDDNVAKIEDVMPDGAAVKAGLLAGDVVVKIDGKTIAGRQNLVETIKSHQPGDKVEIVIRRDGTEQTVSATLGSWSQLTHGDRAEFQNSLGGQLSDRRAGFPSAIQHDSMLRPADCGGPIVDLDGKVVGLNIARAGRVESYALPAALVRETVKKLLQTHLTSAPAAEPAPESTATPQTR
jgi:serine protease Do